MTTSVGTWHARAVINASGTWNNPRLPVYPGADAFLGAQLHTRDYVSADAFTGQRVAVVGGGISAVQLLEELSAVTDTRWYTRREPVFLEGEFEPRVHLIGFGPSQSTVGANRAGRAAVAELDRLLSRSRDLAGASA